MKKSIGIFAAAMLACRTPTPTPPVVADSSTTQTAASASLTLRTPSTLRLVALDPESDLPSTLRIESAHATKDHRVLVMLVGAKWCTPCKHLHQAITDGLSHEYDALTIIESDVDVDDERLKAAGYTSKTIPYLARVGADGRPIEGVEVTEKGARALPQMLSTLQQWAAKHP